MIMDSTYKQTYMGLSQELFQYWGDAYVSCRLQNIR